MASTARFATALVSASLAVGAAYWVLNGRAGDPDLALVDGARGVADALAERAREGGARWLSELDEPTARRLFTMNNPNFRYDPDCYYRFVAGVDETFEWPEHPRGEWTRITNGEGWREDDERALSDGAPRVLVTGDSHTEGACDNHESFANVLERALDARNDAPQGANVLNAGVVGYSFYNYLGVVRKYLPARPDAVVVAVYGGNDFLETLAPHHWFLGTELPPRRVDYWEKIERAIRVSDKAVAQGLNQVVYFRENPDQLDVALEAALETAEWIAAECERAGVPLVYVYVPPAVEVWDELEELRERAMAELELSAADLEVARDLAARFFDGLAALEVRCLDATALFAAREAPCFWRRDLHISLEGHAAIAEALDAVLAGDPVPDEWWAAGYPARATESGRFEQRDAAGRLVRAGSFDAGGRRSGEWEEWYEDGTLRSRGAWVDGRRAGPWEWWYPAGTTRKRGVYEDGRQHGKWTELYENGVQRVEGEWRSGRPQGRWIQRDEQGNVLSEGAYVAGERDGEWRIWYGGEHAGTLDRVATFRAGVLHGPFEKWHVDGTLLIEGDYEGGERSGAWVLRHPGGAEKERGEFVHGQREGAWTFHDEQGRLDLELSGEYAAGERIGD